MGKDVQRGRCNRGQEDIEAKRKIERRKVKKGEEEKKEEEIRKEIRTEKEGGGGAIKGGS